MLIKIAITNQCLSRCTSCPSWKAKPVKTMTPEFLRVVLKKLDPHMSVCCINGTGDYLSLSNHQSYSDVIGDYFRQTGTRTFITTVGSFTGSPRINCSLIVCSLNATTHEAFDKHVGIKGGLDRVVANFRDIIANHGVVEIHSLMNNHDPTADLLQMFGDTHARIRISEKMENQLSTLANVGEINIAKRSPCDYLDGLTVMPDGVIRRCCHDWDNASIFGSIWDIDAAIAKRNEIRLQHHEGVFPGICGPCNYNVFPTPPIYYIQ